jgi:ADP-ribose pyrophosphatase YjhB (NUDIX family)
MSNVRINNNLLGSRKNGRGRGRGRGQQGRKQNTESFGIIPWTFINNTWYFLAQMSFSSTHCSFKLDPLRGQKNNNEQPHDAAAREAFEESAHVLDFTRVSADFGNHLDNLYHVRVYFQSAKELRDVVKLYDENREILLKDDEAAKYIKEVEGLAWVKWIQAERSAESSSKLRLASQLQTMLNKDLGTRDNLPCFCFKCETSSTGVTSFVAFVAADIPEPITVEDSEWSCSKFAKGEEHESKLHHYCKEKLRNYPEDKYEMIEVPGEGKVNELLTELQDESGLDQKVSELEERMASVQIGRTASKLVNTDQGKSRKNQQESKTRGFTTEQQPCGFYNSNGWCRYGNNCRYLHTNVSGKSHPH